MRRASIAILLAIAVTNAFAHASAHNGPGATLRCRDADTGAVFGWVKGGDNTIGDTDIQALRIALNEGELVNCQNPRSGIEGQGVASVRNLSFTFLEPQELTGGGTLTADSPRFEVVFTNNTIAYLYAAECNDPLERTEGKWGRADFTGQLGAGDCTIHYGVNAYTSTGTDSAWTLFAEANPTLVVASAKLVVDDAGRYRVDQIAIQNHMWSRAEALKVVHCATETSC